MATCFKVKNIAGIVFAAFKIPSAGYESTSFGSAIRERLAGSPSYRLEDGTHLNKQDDGTFINPSSNETLSAV